MWPLSVVSADDPLARSNDAAVGISVERGTNDNWSASRGDQTFDIRLIERAEVGRLTFSRLVLSRRPKPKGPDPSQS
jgi:hypothetical protein